MLNFSYDVAKDWMVNVKSSWVYGPKTRASSTDLKGACGQDCKGMMTFPYSILRTVLTANIPTYYSLRLLPLKDNDFFFNMVTVSKEVSLDGWAKSKTSLEICISSLLQGCVPDSAIFGGSNLGQTCVLSPGPMGFLHGKQLSIFHLPPFSLSNAFPRPDSLLPGSTWPNGEVINPESWLWSCIAKHWILIL